MTARRDGKKDRATLVEELSREARALWVPVAPAKDDLDDAERALFAKIEAHERLPKIGGHGARGIEARFWGPVALVTAIAAAALVFAHPRDDGPSVEADRIPASTVPGVSAAPIETPRPTAPAELAAVTRGGEVRFDGTGVVAREASLHDGQTVDSRGGEAVFAAPGRVDWLLESGTEVGTTRAGTHGGAIVLALRVGAVEAQVVPVPAGEAFAVDVDGVRVAVHGTHLRVAREERGGTHVVVDLTEGVISVGAPPKAGSTVGLLVYAPAHVEFSVADLEGTMHIDHNPASVRAPVDPGALALAERARSTDPSSPLSPATQLTAVGAPPVTAPLAAGPRAPSAPLPKPPSPTEVILAAARKCADGRVPPAGEGAVTISSVLNVDVNDDGTVRVARFDPPLAPDLQACVSITVFATRWTEAGQQRIPIELHR